MSNWSMSKALLMSTGIIITYGKRNFIQPFKNQQYPFTRKLINMIVSDFKLVH